MLFIKKRVKSFFFTHVFSRFAVSFKRFFNVLKSLKIYNIPISTLKHKVYDFDYTLHVSFFEHFGNVPFENGSITADVELNNEQEGFFILKFSFKGKLEVICDRCLDPMNIDISDQHELIFKYTDTESILEEDVVFLPMETGEINIAQYIYEFANLSLPHQNIHPDIKGKSICNKTVIKHLNKSKKDTQENHDPRWDQLFNLKNTAN